jgi:tetratricopeptide (TPR) repeat protein
MLECYNQCGSAYLNDGKLEKAKTVYEKIVRLTPEDKEAVNKLYEVNKLLQAAPE